MDPVPSYLAGFRALRGGTDLSRGLRELGIRADSANSVLYLWARRFPTGLFDGHRSVIPPPDHLLYHVLTRRIIVGLFDLLSNEESELVGTSLRDSIARGHLASTRIYHPKTEAVISVGISEWAATLTISAAVIQRDLPRAVAEPGASTLTTPWQAGLILLEAFTKLVSTLYYYPRAELDGETTCQSRPTVNSLGKPGDHFIPLLCAACLRGDTAAFGRAVNVPNLHRLREPLDHAIPALHHVRHAQELMFEKALQPLKRAIITGSGRDDAGRALERARQCEHASRISLEPSFCGIAPEWLLHAEVRAALRQTMPLCNVSSSAWRCWGGVLPMAQVPVRCKELVDARFCASFSVTWWGRVTGWGAPATRWSREMVFPCS